MKERSALVIVDVQTGFLNEHTKDIPDRILRHLETHHYNYVVGTMYVNNEHTACYEMGGFYGCMDGTEDIQVPTELLRKMNLLYDKNQFSCWTPTFEDFVKRCGINKLYFCGINTDCCVLLSAVETFERKMEFEVLTSLCGCMFGEEGHAAGITAMKNCLNPKRIVEE